LKRGHKAEPDPILEAMRIGSSDERSAVEFMEARRWGDCPACPRCGSLAVYTMKDATTGERNKDFRWRCRDCKRMYTVRTGTVYEESRLPLHVWVHAFWAVCASKKGKSALQLSRECGIAYKSALFVMHRIRAAMSNDGAPRPKMTGTVEVDETYVGGKPRNKGPWNKRGTSGKIPVIGIVQRGGDLRLSVMDRVTVDNLAPAIAANVDLSSRLCTDESSAYARIGQCFEGGHESVAHGRREYARGDVHSNTIEGAFSLLKRGIYGTFHSVSRKHLARYLAEFEFRYNARKITDGERTELAIKGADGKRLTYAQQIAG
jgi:transposase-like protein